MLIPSVAIVILNWNGRHYLQQFLPSVLASSYQNASVTVADNGSSDDSVSWLQQHYPQVRIIGLPQNVGFAKGYNDALKQVQADYYVLLNSDVEVQPGWIEPVISLMESDTTIAACQPKLLSYSNRALFEYAGAAGGWIDCLGYPFARGRLLEAAVCETDNGQYDDEAPIFWASGAAMFVRPAAYHGCGGFDDYFFAHMEEIDLCWRMQLAGHRIMVCPQSVVYHVGGGTLPKGSARKTFLNFRNNLIMLYKNLPRRQLLWKLPLRLLLDGGYAVKCLFSAKDRLYAWPVWRAQLAFGYWWLFRRGQRVWPASRAGHLPGWLGSSILWAHFVQGKRKFSQIVGRKPV